MNALHKFVRAHPWLESTLRVAYWVGVAAIPLLLLAMIWESSSSSYVSDLPQVLGALLIVSCIVLFVGSLWPRPKTRRNPSPLELYLALLTAGVLVLMALVIIPFGRLPELSVTEVWSNFVAAYRDLWRHDYTRYDWTIAPVVPVCAAAVAAFWALVSWLLVRKRVAPLWLYLAFLLATFIVLSLIVVLVWGI